jgi:hypothetical protein
MRSGRKGRRLLVALVVAVVALVVGGVAYATIPDGSGVYTGCAQTTTGVLRLIDPSKTNCRADEHQVTWNQTGPPGSAGANGASLGLSDVNYGGLTLPIYASDTIVATLPNVPPGSYMITASVALTGYSAGSEVDCTVHAGSDEDLASGNTIAGPTTVPLIVSHTFGSTGTVTVSCSAANGALAVEARIAAIQVQSLTQTTG